ncbi:MAG: hypothetical protein NZ959_01880 [Armatimonadetes bacterium]|nr:hypothetical protein [Armatimonadota bacterium]MDW8120809.1 hypothetical protein [Armatimonadota bacterium]
MKAMSLVVNLVVLVNACFAFSAGSARRDLTPSLDGTVYIAGFGQNRTATAVHDPIWVRCLALSDGTTTVALVGLDLIGFFYEPDVVAVRERVRNLIGKPVTVLIAATHNHEGPDTLGLWGPSPFQSGRDEAYVKWVREEIAVCVRDAVRDLRPARLRFCSVRSRRLAETQFDSRLPLVKDDTLAVLRAEEKTTGKVIGTLVNFANHPEALGSRNRWLSADFPWALYEVLDKELGGVTVFWNGAIGGLITPLGDQVTVTDPVTGQPALDASFRKAELIGRMIAEEVLSAPTSTTLSEGHLQVFLQPIFVPLQNPLFRIAANRIIERPVYTKGKPDKRQAPTQISWNGAAIKVSSVMGEDIRTEVGVLAIYHRTTATPKALFLLIPGEIYPELVYGGIVRYQGADFENAPMEPVLMDAVKRLQPAHLFVVGLANDEIGYIIPECEWDENPPWLNNAKERPYGEINSVGPKAARRINEALIGLLKRLSSPRPGAPVKKGKGWAQKKIFPRH